MKDRLGKRSVEPAVYKAWYLLDRMEDRRDVHVMELSFSASSEESPFTSR